jgi:hypothetical protein
VTWIPSPVAAALAPIAIDRPSPAEAPFLVIDKTSAATAVVSVSVKTLPDALVPRSMETSFSVLS